MRGTVAKHLRRQAYKEFMASQDRAEGGLIFFWKRKTDTGQPIYEGQTCFHHPKSFKGIYNRLKKAFRAEKTQNDLFSAVG